ncbi:hypothetical protein LX15_006008 [Streptoalloteichus tenebrarius]|uniref:Uncharacterized protein n=1 Tax=Streptoalloteichus tenebrarius (strain ATCC 17920 / DSM 40477 / JCM 4838 / CBS 697.72 / NBRC 16177 / NCIMB 11028 / NRRL B-12390 / A12253. 1 / ISP 5477) TaxID=1933 RepID=A0ABT1I3A6_STRSD|nr:hypothetical protein [Streptoalloteichus tenebrarius]MCP2262272.1 hypothetical protein [Streptoalloteichus tenebrarius]BFF01566.1 hypothetical protein GCM10020241_32410 [Streptoalloteichus tenebrarius]
MSEKIKGIKTVLGLVVGMILGLVLIVVGISTLSEDEVTCGSRVMKPGDTCTTSKRRGGSTTRDYEEQKDSNETAGWALTIIGPIMFLGCGGVLTAAAVMSRRMKAAQAQGAGAPGSGYPTPQGDWGQSAPMGAPTQWAGPHAQNSQHAAPAPVQPVTNAPPMGAPGPMSGAPVPPMAPPAPNGYPQAPNGYPPVPNGYPPVPNGYPPAGPAPASGTPAPGGFPPPPPGHYPPQPQQWGNQPPQWGGGPR